MKNLVLLGAGSGTREILMVIERINARSPEWNVLGFLDENPNVVGSELDGHPVFGPDYQYPAGDVYGICGIIDPKVRQRMLTEYMEHRGGRLATIISPDVVVPADFVAGPGTVVMPSVTISFDVQLGKGVFVLWGAALGHHLRAGEFVTVLTYALVSGGCTIGRRTTIGAHATLSVRVNVGEDCMIGVGTTIFQNVADGRRVVALPRLIETSEKRETEHI